MQKTENASKQSVLGTGRIRDEFTVISDRNVIFCHEKSLYCVSGADILNAAKQSKGQTSRITKYSGSP